MREILFRGKNPVSDEWAYGSLILEKNAFDERLILAIISDADENETLVNPETISQYTGLTDKNGTRIFEGDILEGDLDDDLDLGAKWRSTIVMGKFGWLADDPTGTNPTPLDELDIKEGEVIGNIHDNPELMEVER